MSHGRKIAAANAAMAIGVLPMLGWLALLVRSVFRLRSGEFDLSDLMFVGVAGIGAIWAAGLVRGAEARARRVARVLVSVTAAVLLLPWGGVLALIGSRFFE